MPIFEGFDSGEIERVVDLLNRAVDWSASRLWVYQATVNLLRAEQTENVALAKKWYRAKEEGWTDGYECRRLFDVAFAANTLALAPAILERIKELDVAADAALRAVDDCEKAAEVDDGGTELQRASDHFESCRARHENLIFSFRRWLCLRGE